MKNSISLGLKNYALILAIMLLSACSKEVEPNVEQEKSPKQVVELNADENLAFKIAAKGTVRISEEDAIKKVQQYYAAQPSTKGAPIILNIKSCKLVQKSSAKTKRGVSENSGYYIVDFASNGKDGYSCVSADERIPILFSFFEYGNIEDTVQNVGLRMFINALPEYIESEIEKFELSRDSLYESAQAKVLEQLNIEPQTVRTKYIPSTESGAWEYLGEGGEMTSCAQVLATVNVKWGQSSPFNDLLPEMPGVPAYNYGRSFVGCVPIAVAQTLSYHKRNFSNFITYSDWLSFETIPFGANQQLKQMLLTIFDALQTRASATGTSSSLERAITFLRQNGFSTGDICNFNFDKVYSSLSSSPVIIDGFSSNDNKASGHAWILDGAKNERWQTYDYYRREYKGELIEMKSAKMSYSFFYVRCNWGWNGSSDGWASEGVFRPSGNEYSYDNDIIPYIQ